MLSAFRTLLEGTAEIKGCLLLYFLFHLGFCKQSFTPVFPLFVAQLTFIFFLYQGCYLLIYSFETFYYIFVGLLLSQSDVLEKGGEFLSYLGDYAVFFASDLGY